MGSILMPGTVESLIIVLGTVALFVSRLPRIRRYRALSSALFLFGATVVTGIAFLLVGLMR